MQILNALRRSFFRVVFTFIRFYVVEGYAKDSFKVCAVHRLINQSADGIVAKSFWIAEFSKTELAADGILVKKGDYRNL